MDYSFVSIIKQVNSICTSQLADEVKLRRSGELFYRGSLDILTQVEAALELVRQQEVDLADTSIDNSFGQFLASLTQQSISTLFLKQYLQPRVRVKYERESTVRIESLTPVEAVNQFDFDLLESEVISLANEENINAWVEQVVKCLESNPKINTLPQIVKATELSLAQVFISLLFGEFELVKVGRRISSNGGL